MTGPALGSSVSDVAVEGGAVRAEHAGAGAPALILLHGWTLDRRIWAPQMAALSRARQTIAIDRRGFGQSSAPPNLAREADDLVRILDHFELARAVMVGMSQAGRVALDFAMRFPDRTAALVLQGAPLSGVTPGPGAEETIPIVEYAALAREGRLDEMKRRWIAHPLMRAATAQSARAAQDIVLDYAGRDLGAVSYMRDAEPQDLAAITQPTLVITGAQDTPWRRRAGDALARAISHARRVEIDDAGHLCNLCRPDAYNDVLEQFLAAL